jgi:hypothetical protein
MTTYLDYYKTILKKVSFDRHLFLKEYHKAIRDLNTQEIEDLNKWIQSTEFHNILGGRINNRLMHDHEMRLSSLS